MTTQVHPLESFIHQVVKSSFIENIDLNDAEIIDYVVHMVCEFSDPDKQHRLKDAHGQPIERVAEMVRHSDPVYGTAASFDEERSMRKYIGDYAMFVAGIRLDVVESAPNYQSDRTAVNELIRIGQESYFVVSRFDQFEYENEAPLFARLAECLDRCILGLALVRDEIAQQTALRSAQI